MLLLVLVVVKGGVEKAAGAGTAFKVFFRGDLERLATVSFQRVDE